MELFVLLIIAVIIGAVVLAFFLKYGIIFLIGFGFIYLIMNLTKTSKTSEEKKVSKPKSTKTSDGYRIPDRII